MEELLVVTISKLQIFRLFPPDIELLKMFLLIGETFRCLKWNAGLDAIKDL